ncbi:MAG TPA: hypothetical protein VKS60_01220 [Stellaceae bacterium]|nr:hypothetical protein [Stellaceae bacterium]
MDLGVSPDIDAVWCYGFVSVLGAWVGARQIRGRLGGIKGIWFQRRAWFLFIAYTAVPIVLFWLLDRTGAVTDTSLFAAVLIGLGYERILSGQDDALRVPGPVSSFWTPFLAYADTVTRAVADQTARDQTRLDEELIATIAAKPERYAALEALALSRALDRPALQARLDQIAAGANPADEADARDRKTRLLYPLLLVIPDINDLMYRRGIITGWVYWVWARRVNRYSRSLGVVAILLAALVAGAWELYPSRNVVAETYYVWRLGKANSTELDRFRARLHLVWLMQDDPSVRTRATEDLARLVRRPDLAMDRVELALQLLLESREVPDGNTEVPKQLVQALRAGSVDVRDHVQQVLKSLAGLCKLPADDALWQWKPAEDEATGQLETRIQQWEAYWNGKTC